MLASTRAADRPAISGTSSRPDAASSMRTPASSTVEVRSSPLRRQKTRADRHFVQHASGDPRGDPPPRGHRPPGCSPTQALEQLGILSAHKVDREEGSRPSRSHQTNHSAPGRRTSDGCELGNGPGTRDRCELSGRHRGGLERKQRRRSRHGITSRGDPCRGPRHARRQRGQALEPRDDRSALGGDDNAGTRRWAHRGPCCHAAERDTSADAWPHQTLARRVTADPTRVRSR